MQKTGCASQGFSVTQKAKDGKAEALATVWGRRGVGDKPAFGGKEAKGRADGQRHRSDGNLREDRRGGQRGGIPRRVRQGLVDDALGRPGRRLVYVAVERFGNAGEEVPFGTGKRRVKLPPTAGCFDKHRIFVNRIEALELRADVIAFQFGMLILEDVRRRGRFKEGFELPADIVVYVRLRGKGGTQEKPESKKQRPSTEREKLVVASLMGFSVFMPLPIKPNGKDVNNTLWPLSGISHAKSEVRACLRARGWILSFPPHGIRFVKTSVPAGPKISERTHYVSCHPCESH